MKGIGTTVTESAQLAISVINHSGLFSANIPIILRSGVPSVLDLTNGHNLCLTNALERSSTWQSASSHVSH